MHRGEPGLGQDLAIGADAPDVMRAPERQHRHAVHAREPDRDLHRIARDHLAVAAVALDGRQRAGLHHDRAAPVGLQHALADVGGVGRQHADAVAVMAGEVRGDEIVGDDAGLARVAAECLQRRDREAGQRVGRIRVSAMASSRCGAEDRAAPQNAARQEELGDLLRERCEARRAARGQAARARHVDVEDAIDAPGARRHHDDAVGEQDRLVDRVRDEQHGLARGASQSASRSTRICSRVSASSAPKGSSISSSGGSCMSARDRARWRMPPESSCG
jgi:hypothetical protein